MSRITAAQSARLQAERWGREAGARVWRVKTARLTPEQAIAEEARAHDAATRAAHAARQLQAYEAAS